MKVRREEKGSIIESVDSISRDEPDSPLRQYITNTRISRLISNRMSV